MYWTPGAQDMSRRQESVSRCPTNVLGTTNLDFEWTIPWVSRICTIRAQCMHWGIHDRTSMWFEFLFALQGSQEQGILLLLKPISAEICLRPVRFPLCHDISQCLLPGGYLFSFRHFQGRMYHVLGDKNFESRFSVHRARIGCWKSRVLMFPAFLLRIYFIEIALCLSLFLSLYIYISIYVHMYICTCTHI